MFSVGCTTIYLLSSISIERLWKLKTIILKNKIKTSTKTIFFNRYLSIFYPNSSFQLKYFYSFCLIISCVILGSFWAILPLVGWSYYSLESHRTSCCVEWLDRSTNVISLNVSLFIFVFLLPLSIMVFVCFKLFNMVKKNLIFILFIYFY